MLNVACDLCAATKIYARNLGATISVRADPAGAFKRCCLRSGRYDGSERNYFFPRIDTKKERRLCRSFSFCSAKLDFDELVAVALLHVVVEDDLELFDNLVAL
jgi:hypothetical protein